jgi:hypothetical protein
MYRYPIWKNNIFTAIFAKLLFIIKELGMKFNQIGMDKLALSVGDSINFATSSFDCELVLHRMLNQITFYKFLWMVVFTPLIMNVMMLVFYYMLVLCMKRFSASKKMISFTLINTYLFLFSSVSYTIVSFFSCRTIGSKQYLKADVRLICYGEEHSKFMFSLLMPNFLFYNVIVPWLLYINMAYNKNNLDSYAFAYKYRILY